MYTTRKIKMKKIIITIILLLPILIVENIFAQGFVRPNGVSLRASSQLVYWYDNDLLSNVVNGRLTTTFIQVTNTNDSSGVWIHVQIYKSENPGNNATLTEPNTSFDQVTRCNEVNFVDFLTPRDTHVYTLPFNNFFK